MSFASPFPALPASRPQLLEHVLTIKSNVKVSAVSRRGDMRTHASPQQNRPSPGGRPLRVPSSKELQRMRQFRQNQMFRQQQQMAKRLVEKTTVGNEEAGNKGVVEGDRVGGPSGRRGSSKDKKAPGSHGSHGKKSSVRGRERDKENRDGKDGVGSKTNSKQRACSPPSIKDGRTKEEWLQFAQSNGFESSWRAQVHILQTLGLTATQLSKVANARVEIFNTSAKTLTRKISFFREVLSMSDAEIVKLVSKSPRVLEYGSEQTVRPRIEFLERCGVPTQVISKVVLKAPMIMSLGMKETLEPRVEFLKKSLHLNKSQMGKLISRHPQVLTCTEDMMQQRVDFLLDNAGVRASDLSKVVVAHPQVLHYKLDSMMERLEYLGSVGMRQEDIAQAVARFPQIFSLSVTTNMAPKWHYLVEHLGGDVKALCSYPGYFSLSLSNRIQMRHLYLGQVCDGGAPMPFPLSYLKMSDEKFAVEIAGETLDAYEQFKKQVAMGGEHGIVSSVDALSEFDSSVDEGDDDGSDDDDDDAVVGAQTSVSTTATTPRSTSSNVLGRAPNLALRIGSPIENRANRANRSNRANRTTTSTPASTE